ncbi:MAG: DUF4360 domain-containing protein [Cocleimonas sp.]|nr:DUF4360 domain-containing protein [Cocleimonas sp.]
MKQAGKAGIVAAVAVAAGIMAQTSLTTSGNKAVVYFKSAAIAGSGCSAGTTQYTIDPNGTRLRVNFDNYFTESDNKSCNIAIPVHVPSGFQVASVSARFSGHSKGQTELRYSLFVAGDPTSGKKKVFSSDQRKGYLVDDTKILQARCGEDIMVRLNSRIRTQNDQSRIQVGWSKKKEGLVLQLQYRQCQ